MATAWYRFRAEARRGWKAWLAVGVLVGMGSGAVLALIIGARRTDSAIDRFVAQANPGDVEVVSGEFFDFAKLDFGQVAALPGVADSVPSFILGVNGVTADGAKFDNDTVSFVVDPSGRTGADVDRVKMLEGRHPRPDQPTEVTVSFRTAEALSLDVGDAISATFLTAEDLFGGPAPPASPGPPEELRVVGTYATVRELTSFGSEGVPLDIRFSPAAFGPHRESAVVPSLNVLLADGAEGVPAFLERVQALGGGAPVFAISRAESVSSGKDAVRPVSRALMIGGILLGIVVLLLGGQALARQAGSEAGDDPTLMALGFTGGRLVAVRALKAAVIGATAALTAAMVALAASPLFPIGLAGIIEPRPGARLDGAALALGVPTIGLALAGIGTVVGWWSTRRALRPDRPPRPRPQARAVDLLAGAGARPPAVAGVRAALAGGSGGIVSASVGTVAVGLLATIGAVAFGSSLDHLTASPALYGWNWDVRLGKGSFSAAFDDDQVAALARDPAVTALAIGTEADVDLGGRSEALLGLENIVGDIEPSLISGRAASDLGEVVVAPGIAAVGEQLIATFGDARAELRVVGVAALPDVGGAVTFDTLHRLVPDAPTQIALARVASPAALGPFVDRSSDLLGLEGDDYALPALNEAVANFGRVERLPFVLAVLMGLVAIGALLHALLLSVGNRRRELAVLKVLGFTRGQVLASVAAHATTLTTVALALGLPLGIALGRALWLRFADGLGVVPVAVVPVLATGLVVTLAVVIANLAATFPGRRAARTPAAAVLRSE